MAAIALLPRWGSCQDMYLDPSGQKTHVVGSSLICDNVMRQYLAREEKWDYGKPMVAPGLRPLMRSIGESFALETAIGRGHKVPRAPLLSNTRNIPLDHPVQNLYAA